MLRLQQTDGRPYDYRVPEQVYRYHTGDLLVDPHVFRPDVVVMGAMFMVGRQITFSVDRGVIGIR